MSQYHYRNMMTIFIHAYIHTNIYIYSIIQNDLNPGKFYFDPKLEKKMLIRVWTMNSICKTEYVCVCVSTFICINITWATTVLTADVWKAMTECKSSFPFLENGEEAAELRSPENSVSPLLLTCTYTTQHNTTTQNQSINFQIKAEMYCNETEIDSENRSTWREELATDRAAEAIAAEEN